MTKKRRILVRDLPRSSTVAAYKTADVFFFPSNIEASPLVLFEAMAAKLPFITGDVGNSREIISWSHGGKIIPTTFDDEGYSHIDTNAAVSMLKDMHQASYRKKFSIAGYKAWKEHFTWEKITDKYEKLYREFAR